jgi:hypothetical protein
VQTKTTETQYYNPWAQWDCAKVPTGLMRRADLSDGAKLLYGVLCYRARSRGFCYAGQDTLAEDTGSNLRSVQRRIGELVDAGLLVVEQRGKKKTNIYHFPALPELLAVQTFITDDEVEELEAESDTTNLAEPGKVTRLKCRVTAGSDTPKVACPQEGDEVRRKDTKGGSDFPPVLAYWNSQASLPGVKSFSAGRKKHLAARMRDDFFAANWQLAIDLIVKSDFCTGKNDRGWVATFDWLLKPDTVTRIMEGRYDNRKGVLPSGVQRGQRPPPRPGDSGSLKGGDDYKKRLNIVGGDDA